MKQFSKLLFAILFLLPFIKANGATFVGDREDFRDETIYFAITTRFYDGDPKNNVLSWDKQDVQIANNDPDWRGDFAGLIDKLDYIKALGFTAVWITPVTQNASGEDYHGYHSMDFSSVDLRYESRKEWGCSKDVKFQDLIDAAHAKGMKIILDIVLNHTSNFGEATLNPLFTRDQNIKNQATPAGALIPNTQRLSANYFDQDGNKQYQERFKFFKNPQYDNHNYYHHYGTGWNWDLPNRWWGQIAGDCVDLNTENDVVAQHLVKCYGEFIKMGVDGFRIDTTGHIARLTFNTQFIPQFLEIAEQYKNKRLNGCPFFMFGECCARYGGVIYRDQHNLSSHFYTWKSDQSLINTYKSHSSGAWWDTQTLNEGHDSPVGPMVDCESEKTFNKNSNNVFLSNSRWHTPDYSQYSGFSVIDFPMHYNFSNAGSAVNIAKEGDKYYNDASYNVVYVDSHDYSPQPNDNIRFNGGTAQWAENLSLMFTFRGIPCIYYGSEVEFMAGKPIDVGGENNKTPRKESGRAYFGHYLDGSVTASDFGVYTASGNVQTTLNGDLAHHIRRLNKIRAAVPALRKGQYTFDGCSANGGWAFKRGYKDSYALVAINGGATFSNVPGGTYVDVVTGQSYTANENGTITVSSPNNKGQLRVLVKGWTGGKIDEDGKFIYTSSPKAHGGQPSFTDAGTTQYYTAKDVIGHASVNLNPAGGSFKTETLTVSVSLNEAATSGWYKIGNGSQVNLTSGKTSTFTIGSNMSYGETVNVTWSATGNDGVAYTGTSTYKKVDPNAVITVYVKANNAPYLYVWDATNTSINGAWPGAKMTATTIVGGENFYYLDVPDSENFNIILSDGNGQTEDIKGIQESIYIKYNGGSSYEKISAPVATPGVSLSPNGGSFKTETLSVTATLNNSSKSGWYKIGNGNQVNLTPGKSSTFTIGEGMNYGDKITVSWSATDGTTTKTGSATYTKTEPSSGITIYVTAPSAPYLYAWDANGNLNGEWPGKKLSETTTIDGKTFYFQTFNLESLNIIFNMGKDGPQTSNIENVTSDTYYSYDGNTGYKVISVSSTPDNPENPGTTPDEGFTIYFDNSESNWPTPYVHYWGSQETTWPGVAMTPVSGNIWKFDVPAGTTGLVFNNNNQGEQTDDFSAQPNHIYTKTQDKGVYEEGSQGGGDNPSNPGDGGEDNPNNPGDGGEDNPNNPGDGGEDNPNNPGDGGEDNPNNPGDGGEDNPNNPGDGGEDNPNNPGDGGEDNPSDSVNSIYSNAANVWAADGKIYIEVPTDMEVMIIRLDGRYHIERVFEGINIIEGLPHGMYIVNGVKVMI